MSTEWIIAGLAGLAALWFYFQYRGAQRQSDLFREQARQRMQELLSLGYSEDKVGRRVAAVGDASLDAVIVFKSDHSIIYLNPVAESLFGRSAAAPTSLIALTRHHEIDKLASDALAGQDDLDRQMFVGGRTVRARAATFAGGAVLCLTDVSELQRLGRARRDFIANISHELRTPPTAIRLLTDTLKSPAGKDPTVARGLVDKIMVETGALSQLAQELLDLSAIESGQVMMKMLPAPLKPVIEATVERQAELAARKGQTVAVDVPDGLKGLMDESQIERAILNLLHNAIKFTPSGGRVSLRAEAAAMPIDRRSGRQMDGQWLQVEVQDTGQGIDRGDLPRIFERFYRADRSRSTGGTGLGLAIAKHIVEAHGGCIWAESDGPGRGATFRFLIPQG
jgi:two-component system phosphate regulon sensor histidine kinase PhoR